MVAGDVGSVPMLGPASDPSVPMLGPASDPSVVGAQPSALLAGFVVLLLVIFTGSWAGSLVTVAHEGGHMALAALTGRNHQGFSTARGNV